jgi:hypothetical protein
MKESVAEGTVGFGSRSGAERGDSEGGGAEERCTRCRRSMRWFLDRSGRQRRVAAAKYIYESTRDSREEEARRSSRYTGSWVPEEVGTGVEVWGVDPWG